MKHILQAGQGDHLFVLTDLITIKVSAKDTANQYSTFEEIVPPLGGPPLHRHAEVELFYVVEGTFAFTLGEQQPAVRVKAGGVVHVPAYVVHRFKNVGGTVGKLLITALPGKIEHFFHAIGSPVADEASTMLFFNEFDGMDMDGLLAAASTHGIEFFP